MPVGRLGLRPRLRVLISDLLGIDLGLKPVGGLGLRPVEGLRLRPVGGLGLTTLGGAAAETPFFH